MKEEVMYQGENIKERGKIFIKLLLPVLIYQVISYSSGMIGTFMAGHYSPTDLAGVSMGVNIWNPVMYTLNAIVLAIVPIVSHLIGKKREEEISVMVRQFLYIAVLISIILVGVLMALYMLKTDNIWGVASLHGAWNFTQGNLVGVAVSGQNAGDSLLRFPTKSGVPDWLSGGALWSRR